MVEYIPSPKPLELKSKTFLDFSSSSCLFIFPSHAISLPTFSNAPISSFPFSHVERTPSLPFHNFVKDVEPLGYHLLNKRKTSRAAG
jgi:hypothetical protein